MQHKFLAKIVTEVSGLRCIQPRQNQAQLVFFNSPKLELMGYNTINFITQNSR